MDTDSYVALRRLQSRYADIVTRRSWGELREIFQPGCGLVLDLGDRRLSYRGPDEIGAFIDGSIAQYSFFQFVVLNTVMEIDEPGGRAASRIYMHELRVGREDGRRSDAYGVYHDLFERDASGAWRFADRLYNSFSRTAPAEAPEDQVVFPLVALDLKEVLEKGRLP